MITPFTATSCFTMQCADTQTGVSVTRCYTASSIISQSDADKRAEAAAQQTAYAALLCEFPAPPGAVVFFNLPLSGDRNCLVCEGSGLIPVSVPAASFFSYESQESADGAAQNLLDSLESNEDCAPIYYNNTAQSYTAYCPAGSTGSPSTYSIGSGSVCSAVSIAAANAQALVLAEAEAVAALSCLPVYANEPITVTLQCDDEGQDPATPKGPVVVSAILAGTFFSTLSQEDANNMAIAAANIAGAAQEVCYAFGNVSTQSNGGATPDCETEYGSGFVGSSGSVVTVPADTYFSNVSQNDANAQALAAANAEYASSLSCQYFGA